MAGVTGNGSRRRPDAGRWAGLWNGVASAWDPVRILFLLILWGAGATVTAALPLARQAAGVLVPAVYHRLAVPDRSQDACRSANPSALPVHGASKRLNHPRAFHLAVDADTSDGDPSPAVAPRGMVAALFKPGMPLPSAGHCRWMVNALYLLNQALRC
ncbi:hypothetical protein DESC_880011 [Desulfosarcina cetonica]|nr:hypothetical protein DESC_880011 [Desulfosarcina cetonica]